MGEGKKRQIREIGKLLGLPVVKIIRLRIGTLKLGGLKPRQWRYLTPEEVMELKGEKVKDDGRSEKFREKPLHPTDRPKRVTRTSTPVVGRKRDGVKSSPTEKKKYTRVKR
jgi:23S rRNA pseudouridine2605 synthase